MYIKVKKVYPDVELPEYQTHLASGMDLRACLGESLMLQAGDIQVVPTGLVMEIPRGYEGQVRSRSGLATKGVTVANSPGTIDADYRGEIKVIMANLSSEPFVINPGDRIAQLVIAEVAQVKLLEDDDMTVTGRGSHGFGGTGIT